MIEINNLTMHYTNHSGIIVKNLTINDGEIIGVFGQNGAGKTTLLKVLSGLLKAESGEVLFDGERLNYSLYNDIAYISEELSLFFDYDIAEHKAFYAQAFERFNSERFDKLVKFFDLPHARKVRTFSKGEKAKLELAIGFSKSAKYIFLDEPFLGSDPLVRADFLKVMAGLIEDGDIIIIATHLLGEIEQFIDRSILIQHGRVIGDFAAEEILQKGGLLAAAKEIFGYDSKKIENLFL